MHLSPAALKTTVDGARLIGGQLRSRWSSLPTHVDSAVGAVSGELESESSVEVAGSVLGVAAALGYTASGLQAISGSYKLYTGVKSKSLARQVDGVFDLATSAAVATTVAGLAVGPWVLAPLSVSLGVVRGVYNSVRGYARGDARQEIQGALDATRSASVGLRMAGYFSPALTVAGKVLGPIGGALQLGRGLYDVGAGIEKQDLSKQAKGFADIATAVGLTMALTGVATLPGVALAAAGLGSSVGYSAIAPFRGVVNKGLKRVQRPLQKFAEVVQRYTRPLAKRILPVWEKVVRRERGNDPRPPCGGQGSSPRVD